MAIAEIDWSSAKVHDAKLVVELAPQPSPDWRTRAKSAVRLLERTGQAWEAIAVKKDRIVVTGIHEGAEDDVRHFLESVVLQANAEEARPDDEPVQTADGRMTAAFQAFAG